MNSMVPDFPVSIPPEWSNLTPILLFDGECGLCHFFIRCLRRFDCQTSFYFASLQSPAAILIFQRLQLQRTVPDSLLLIEPDGVFWEGGALVRTASHLGRRGKKLSRLLERLPRTGLDRLYRWVARHRKDWLVRQTCSLPSSPVEFRLLEIETLQGERNLPTPL